MKPDGKIVILFSNFSLISGIIVQHLIDKNLNDSKAFKTINLTRGKAAKGNVKKYIYRMNSLKDLEPVELWEIKRAVKTTVV